jgi:hypothetical protein
MMTWPKPRKLEAGLKIQFSHYSGQQFKRFKQQWDQASAHDNEKRTKTHQVFQQYPHLKVFNGEVFQNGKRYSPKQIYIYTQHYKRDVSDLTDMIAYISLYDHPVIHHSTYYSVALLTICFKPLQLNK